MPKVHMIVVRDDKWETICGRWLSTTNAIRASAISLHGQPHRGLTPYRSQVTCKKCVAKLKG